MNTALHNGSAGVVNCGAPLRNPAKHSPPRHPTPDTWAEGSQNPSLSSVQATMSSALRGLSAFPTSKWPPLTLRKLDTCEQAKTASFTQNPAR